jgi:hypothetical protein
LLAKAAIVGKYEVEKERGNGLEKSQARRWPATAMFLKRPIREAREGAPPLNCLVYNRYFGKYVERY